MCGLVYAHNFDGSSVNKEVWEQFDKQRARGTKGFGLFDGQTGNLMRHPEEKGIKELVDKYQTNLMMFHHRYPTSTVNTKKACHPFSTGKYFDDGKICYVLIHNGWINNDKSLKEKHEELGINYQSVLKDNTFNDSEALLWEVALYLEGNKESIDAQGAIAFICLKLVEGEPAVTYFGRNSSSPLEMNLTGGQLFLSSSGKGGSIPVDTLHTFDNATKQLSVTDCELQYTTRYRHTTNTAPTTTKPSWAKGKRSETYYGGWNDDHYYDEEEFYRPLSADHDGLGDIKTPHDVKQAELEEAFAEENTLDTLKFQHLIQDTVKKYLREAKGNFSDALILMDAKSTKLTNHLGIHPTDKTSMRSLAIMKGAMKVLVDDPEWEKPDSVSSLFDTTRLIGATA
jgi:ribosomal protein S15P/S13E